MADNVGTTAQFLRSKGLSPAQIAGVIGSMQGESGKGLDPNATNPNGGAYGIAQWLGGRKTALMRRPNPSSLGTQLNHLWSELQGPERGALQALQAAHTPEQAAIAWQKAFERGAPFEQKYGMRAANARSVFNSLGQTVAGQPSPAGTPAATQTTPGVDNSGLRAQAVQQFLGSKNADPVSFAMAIRNAQDVPGTTYASTATPAAGAGTSNVGGTGGYVNPFGSSLKAPGRIDEGVDATIQGPIRAVGNAKVVALHRNFYKGLPYLVYQLTDGPHAGKRIFVAENIRTHVNPGDTVRAGQVIATGVGGIETGWAGGPEGNWLPLANRAQGGDYTEGKATSYGKSFAEFLRRRGANAAR